MWEEAGDNSVVKVAMGLGVVLLAGIGIFVYRSQMQPPVDETKTSRTPLPVATPSDPNAEEFYDLQREAEKLLRDGKMAEVQKITNQLQQMRPDTVYVLKLQGELDYWDGKLEEADKKFAKVYEIVKLPSYNARRCLIAVQRNQAPPGELTREPISKLIELTEQPEYPGGQPLVTARDADTLLEYDDQTARWRGIVGYLDLAFGQTSYGLPYARQAEEDGLKSPLLQWKRGTICSDSRLYEEALAALESGLNYDPSPELEPHLKQSIADVKEMLTKAKSKP